FRENEVIKRRPRESRDVRHDAAVEKIAIERFDVNLLPRGSRKYLAHATSGGTATVTRPVTRGFPPGDFADLVAGSAQPGAADAKHEGAARRKVHVHLAVGLLIS